MRLTPSPRSAAEDTAWSRYQGPRDIREEHRGRPQAAAASSRTYPAGATPPGSIRLTPRQGSDHDSGVEEYVEPDDIPDDVWDNLDASQFPSAHRHHETKGEQKGWRPSAEGARDGRYGGGKGHRDGSKGEHRRDGDKDGKGKRTSSSKGKGRGYGDMTGRSAFARGWMESRSTGGRSSSSGGGAWQGDR